MRRAPRRLCWTLAASLLAGCVPLDETADGGARRDGATPGDAARGDGAPGDAARGDRGAPDSAAPGDGTVDPDSTATDGGAPDGAAPNPSPTPEQAAPPLFGPNAPDATALDAPLAALVGAWQARPDDEASAQALGLALRTALDGVRAGGAAAADRIVERCRRPVLVDADSRIVCLRMLGLVESPTSLSWLSELALTPTPAWPEGAHPTSPAPQALDRRVATLALSDRALAGSETALALLVRLVANRDNPDRRLAVEAIYRARPTARARAILRQALPADEQWRLYEIR